MATVWRWRLVARSDPARSALGPRLRRALGPDSLARTLGPFTSHALARCARSSLARTEGAGPKEQVTPFRLPPSLALASTPGFQRTLSFVPLSRATRRTDRSRLVPACARTRLVRRSGRRALGPNSLVRALGPKEQVRRSRHAFRRNGSRPRSLCSLVTVRRALGPDSFVLGFARTRLVGSDLRPSLGRSDQSRSSEGVGGVFALGPSLGSRVTPPL
jgi:hypothetical protein